MEFLTELARYEQEGVLTPRQGQILRQFHHSYLEALSAKGIPPTNSPRVTLKFLELIIRQIRTPYPFKIYHQQVTAPDDYYAFGMDLVRPLIDFKKSVLLGRDNLERIDKQLKSGHNCVLYSNHQTEPDPQAIDLMLEREYPSIGREIVFLAGHRVISDPIAVPFSQGRNMLCIYSRKHMDHDPSTKADKQQHNRRAMHELVRLLTQGGTCVYIAPSGGRDRLDAAGKLNVAPFDSDAIDLFALMAREAKTPTHFYPLSLATHDLLPPPPVVEKELGEDREFHYTPIGIAFGEELDITYGSDRHDLDKKAQRQLRRDHIYNKVCDGYDKILTVLSELNVSSNV